MPDTIRHKRVLFVFRRDLRLEDNRALRAAMSSCQTIYLAFNFDPRQLADHPYRSTLGFRFLLAGLSGLSSAIAEHGGTLHFLHGLPHESIPKFVAQNKIDAVWVNADYTPFSQQRDSLIKKALQQINVSFFSVDDICLVAPADSVKQNGAPYTVYTPFYRANNHRVEPAISYNLKRGLLATETGHDSLASLAAANIKLPALNGNTPRESALSILNHLADLQHYNTERDIPAIRGTSRLSSYLKFGVMSAREVYGAVVHNLGYEHPLVRQLFWRDFYYQIAYHFPHVFRGPFKTQYEHLVWSDRADHWRLWSIGKTGFPIVDAGIRELLNTGFMHNRVRMIVSSFLVKDLHIDWCRGESFFARHLEDYDPALNNGNWQWSASTGCDAQPYFRIFNPWLQQKRYDPECVYIKRWIPELSNMEPKVIHSPGASKTTDYPAPIVDHATEAMLAKEEYSRVRSVFGPHQQP